MRARAGHVGEARRIVLLTRQSGGKEEGPWDCRALRLRPEDPTCCPGSQSAKQVGEVVGVHIDQRSSQACEAPWTVVGVVRTAREAEGDPMDEGVQCPSQSERVRAMESDGKGVTG